MSTLERWEFEQGKIGQPARHAVNVASGVDSSHENSISRNGTKVSDTVPFSDSTLAGASSTGWSFSKIENAIDSGVVQVEGSCRCFSLDEVLKATNNFDDTYVIGIGGFGKVYQGFMDDGATVVAIKRLNVESKQGAGEFWTEVNMLSKLRHTNLVALIGYCNECEEMVLVYEYISHGTLANHLYQSSTTKRNTSTSVLTWEQRLNICIGAARGLDHLHAGTNQSFIHRDVKTTNILLDENWVAKISDFGLSKSTTSHSKTHVSTNVKGTFGYLDPHYFILQRLTTKSDVYSFGVVLLEVLCGRPPVDDRLEEDQIGLVHWAQDCIKKGKLDSIIDPSLSGQISPHCLKSFVVLANNCLHTNPKSRPTMAEVLGSLELALASQQRGRKEGIITKAFQIMTDRWLRERERESVRRLRKRESMSSSRGRSRHTITEDLESLDIESVSQQGGRTKGIITTAFQIKMDRWLRERDSVSTSSGQSRPTMAEGLGRLEVPLVSQLIGRREGIISTAFQIIMDQWLRDRKGISSSSGQLNDSPPESDSNRATQSYCHFSLAEIRVATNDFNKSLLVPNSNKVYKGILKIDGKARIVAMKRIKNVEGVAVGSQAKTLPLHPHVVSLIGICREGHELILVYDYTANGSLCDHSQEIQLQLCTGAAQGIKDLHADAENELVHSSIEPSNILSDRN